ncbi:MAG: type IV toxin-antitoxin system AbiEi family antitoxin domain-containing protein [Planctomycetes bacterium]|nr:type IV toxin-antitoxin system AbiEi family antitoxin domain-containing protein [Planctomycetota bacterium]MCC7397512.1 type IV toxin-antitoxin system AbiEi family antitoxin domain-containing protein [Planctomycetota bacterium]
MGFFSTMAQGPELTIERLQRAGLGVFFRPRDVESLGISEPALRTLQRRGVVERIARGLYRLASIEPSEHYTVAAACARNPNAILCLLTALRIHGIGTRQSPEVWLAIPHGTHPRRTEVAAVRTVKFTGVFLTAGVAQTRIEGVPARITNPDRTIVDCLRLQRWVDRETAVEAARDGMRNRVVTASSLLRMAKTCGIADRLRRDIELLAS